MANLARASILLCFLVGGQAPVQIAKAASCAATVGPQKARQYVQQCLDVSPATHPPCNAANACSLIEDEIRRGCRLLGKDAPAFCAPYSRPQ
jgi:hypothetical protein